MEKIEIKDAKEFDAAIKEGKTVVDFYADWCNPCKMLSPVLDEVAEEKKDVRIVKVNVDNVPELATRFNVNSIPNVFLFNNGKQTGNFIGFKYKNEVSAIVDEAFKA